MIVLLVISMLVLSCSSSIRYHSNKKEHTVRKLQTDEQISEQVSEILDSNDNESIDIDGELKLHSIGKASFYGNKFNGRKTASGERFDNSKYTAAHKKLPFGTEIVVENVSNKKRVTVRINDRGPFTKNRILDVSLQAAKELDFVRQGTATIRIYTKKNK